MKIVIKRIAYTDEGAFGVMMLDGMPFALTLERPWRDNRRGESCIPAANYEAVRCRESAEYNYQDSPMFGDTFVVENVPGRKKILFHKGNLDDDTHGCILVGEQFGKLGTERGILASKAGFKEFLTITREIGRFDLSIVNV